MKLNDRQQQAVDTKDGPLLILAGAGSGKTRVIVSRIASLINDAGVNPYHILAITFTNKAAQEMRARVDAAIDFGADAIFISTFHSMCVRFLRRHGELIGIGTNFTIYDSDDSKAILREAFKALEIDPKMLPERSVSAAISSAKNDYIHAEQYLKEAGFDFRKQQIAKLYTEYERRLKASNALDFDDLLVRTVDLFKSCPEVLNAYQERFLYIHVDEYQDTNTVQFMLLSLLAAKYRNLCVVGDDDQSIYKFRGANIQNILGYEKVFQDAVVIKLEQNYRSTPNILNAANALISNNKFRKQKNLWSDTPLKDKIKLRVFDTAPMEARFLANDILKKVSSGIMDYSDVAILYRTNAQSRLIEEQFITAGIPYDIVGAVNFYSRKEIKDVLAYLKTIENGMDDLALRRIINVPPRKIGETTISRVMAYAQKREISFFDALCEAEHIPEVAKAVSKINEFVSMIRGFREKLGKQPLDALLEDVLLQTGYQQMLIDSDKEKDEGRVENVDELKAKVATFMAEYEGLDPTLSELLQEIALVADIDRIEGDVKKVLCMTIHSAKGLEFKCVYLTGLEEDLFPSYMAISSGDLSDIEEERRLAYVGLTRAKEDLTLTYARSRMVRNDIVHSTASRFITEIPGELLDTGEEDDGFRVVMDNGKSGIVLNNERFSGIPNRRHAAKDKPAIQTYHNSYAKQYADNQRAFSATSLGTMNKGSALQKIKPDYVKGDTVLHIKFGKGVIMNLEDTPRDYKVTVDFGDNGIKTMYAAFGKLVKV